MRQQYRKRFDNNIMGIFSKAVKMGLAHPQTLPFFLRTMLSQGRAIRLRKKQLLVGIEVPPLLIISLTRRCNLSCSGCYSKLLHTSQEEELSPERFTAILNEADELGVSIILLAGGEPLLRRDLLEIAAKHPRIIFPVFTNSTLIDQEYIAFFRAHRHLIPVLSLEGRELETDTRRGDGVFQHIRELCPRLKAAGLFWGISLTLTAPSFELQTSERFLREYLDCGCGLFFFVEYVPIESGSAHLTLDSRQKTVLVARVEDLTQRLPGLFIAFPGDEEQYGGCLAAGRGFLHINPSGFAEPCPFAPFSDVDLKFASLKDALKSPLLRKIREAHHLLKESEGGCALWANRDYVAELKKEV